MKETGKVSTRDDDLVWLPLESQRNLAVESTRRAVGASSRALTASSEAMLLDTGCWNGHGKIATVVNGLTFRSNFDSGNLARVILPAEQGGVGGVYQLWTAR